MIKKVERQKMPEQAPEKRVKNFTEVPQGFTPEQAQLEASRCLECKQAFCVKGCPVNVKIPDFIKLIKEGKFTEAAWLIKEDNTLPAICGRVCPQETQCEQLCILGKKGEPVAIGHLERFVADYEREVEKEKIKIPEIIENGIEVAVVGAGPSGLTCAGDLRKLGYSVTIFEALHKPGGVLSYGIPEFRLPKKIVEKEVSYLEKLGVKIKYNWVIGKIKTVDQLLAGGYKAVYIATGAGFPSFMKIPGENFNFVYSANEFLTRVNLMKAYTDYDTPVEVGKRVAVIGGGNTAMDAARSALRLGPEKVYLVYRRSEVEMPARVEEIHHAKQEGVEFLFLTTPIRYEADESFYVKKAVCLRMELGEPDDSGRRRPQPIEGSEFTLDVDSVIVAIGTQANPIIQDSTPDMDANKWGYIVADKDGKTTKEAVFAGGDIVSGAATVIEAMEAGKNAAVVIDDYLRQS